MRYILAIDQGTTSTRAIIFDEKGNACAKSQKNLSQYFPDDGWVEHDPEEIWQATLSTCRTAIKQASLSANCIAAIGISNQRETTVLWERATGKPIVNAIVWQDRRSTALCAQLLSDGYQTLVNQKTGLLLDPYFSASKITWLLNEVPGLRARAERGEICFGTIDSFLIWRFSHGRRHVTDATNASRTALYNIHQQCWDPELLTLFQIPEAVLPEVLDNSAEFAIAEQQLLGAAIPITGVAGDQHAATFGQACFSSGMLKSTYGTGCFMLLNTGDVAVHSKNRLLTTIAYRLQGKVTYGLEGSIFVAGAAVQWLQDAMKFITNATEAEQLAISVTDTGGVYLVPAFTGLGAPYWDPKARGAILGLTRDSGVEHIVRAALEAVCYQSNDLLQAMVADGAMLPNTLRVDGGMVRNDWLMQFLSDILLAPVVRPKVTETSALGVAFLAGLHVGIFGSLEQITDLWQMEAEFVPRMSTEQRSKLCHGWQRAVGRISSTPSFLE